MLPLVGKLNRIIRTTIGTSQNFLRTAKNAANLKLTVVPDRAAVFVDNGYVGHASDFGGAFRSMTVAPGKHKIRVALPGYHDFETDITLAAHQKFEIKAELVKGNVENTAPIN